MTAVWKALLTGDVSRHVSDRDNHFLQYLSKTLHGLVVCGSQVDGVTKLYPKKLIEENDSTYTIELAKLETLHSLHHLKAKSANMPLCWVHIPGIFPDWIHNSAQQGHACDKEEYEVFPRKSTTLNSILGNDMPTINSPDETMQVHLYAMCVCVHAPYMQCLFT